jgi:AcrR family transcriptional regulator
MGLDLAPSLRRREDLTAASLDYVLRNGLLGLSLRPLAASLGTSDRMLIYHFGSKSRLIADVLELANQRLSNSVAAASGTGASPRSPQQVVERAWRLMTSPESDAIARIYLELCALSVREPVTWGAAHRRLREPWLRQLEQSLVDLRMPSERAAVLATVVLDAIDGLILDRLITGESARVDAAARAFGDLLAGRAAPRSRQPAARRRSTR